MGGKEIVDSAFIKGLQNLVNYMMLNAIDIKIEQDRTLRFSEKYKSGQDIYRFFIDDLFLAVVLQMMQIFCS